MVVSVDQVDLMNFFGKDPHLPNIAFTLKGHAVKGGDDRLGYRRLDRLIWDNRITVRRRITDAGFAKAAGAASYFMATDTFSLGSAFKAGGTYGRAILAHEGAHALIDLQDLGTVDRGVSEAIGYLAEALWLDLAGYGPITGADGKPHPVRAEATKLAQKLRQGGNAQVAPADADALAALIRADSQYDDPAPHVSNGIG